MMDDEKTPVGQLFEIVRTSDLRSGVTSELPPTHGAIFNSATRRWEKRFFDLQELVHLLYDNDATLRLHAPGAADERGSLPVVEIEDDCTGAT